MKAGKTPTLVVPKANQPFFKNLIETTGLDDVKALQRLLADNERRPGTHRILVQPANLRLMTDPGFDLIQIEKYAKKEGAYNSSSYKKLCKQAEKEAVLRAAAKANEKSDDEE